MNLFYSFHCLSFPILKGCRLEKGHIVPVLFPFIKEKKKKKDDKVHSTEAEPLRSDNTIGVVTSSSCVEQYLQSLRKIDGRPVPDQKKQKAPTLCASSSRSVDRSQMPFSIHWTT